MIEIDPFVEADSLDLVELITALEETFDVRIPDNEAKKIKTIRHALELMDKLKAKQDTKRQKQAKSSSGGSEHLTTARNVHGRSRREG